MIRLLIERLLGLPRLRLEAPQLFDGALALRSIEAAIKETVG